MDHEGVPPKQGATNLAGQFFFSLANHRRDRLKRMSRHHPHFYGFSGPDVERSFCLSIAPQGGFFFISSNYETAL